MPADHVRFEVVMRHSPVGMAVVAPDGGFLEVNDALCRILGRDEASVLAATWQELTHPDDVGPDLGLLAEVLAGARDSYRMTKRYLRPDGSLVHGDLSVAGVRGADGEVLYLVSQILDVTDQVHLAADYRLLAENVSDVVVLGDNDGVVRRVFPSPAALEWLPEGMEGRRFVEVLHPDDVDAVRRGQEAIRHGGTLRRDVRVRARDGGYRWTAIRVRPVTDDQGRVTGRVAGWWDIHEQREAVQALARSEERFRAAMSAKLEGHVFLESVRDEAGRIVDFAYTEANTRALQYLGLTVGELVGARLLELFPSQRDNGMFDRWVSLVETGEPLSLDAVLLESPVLGQPRNFDMRSVKVGDGFSISWHDVTDRVRAQQALAESEERYRLLAENASDVVVRMTPDGIIDWVAGSTEQLLGAAPEELVGRPAHDNLVVDDESEPQQRLASVLGGDTLTGLMRVRHRDGSTRWVNRRTRAVFGPDGGPRFVVGALSDASAEVAYREALAESERQAREYAEQADAAREEAVEASLAKTAFLSRMSHELRTPLNSVLGFAQLLAMDPLTEEQADAVRQIRTGGKHLLQLINEILDISRIEAGRLSLSLESVSVADAVTEALDLVRPMADAAGVVLVSDAAECGHSVWADRQRTIQVLLNLLSNAVKYNRPRGSVTVVCGPAGDGVLAVRVADTGPGLTEEQRWLAFEPFERLGAERGDVEGTGIGLTLSQALARVMGGRLELESTPGEGSVFSLVLPLTAEAGSGEEVPTAPRPGVAGGRRTTVLYVEDNPANTALMRRIAGLRERLVLRTSIDGAAGLEAARRDPPDLVLLDLHLPDMPGEDVLRELRADPALAEVPVVVVTADASTGVERRVRSLGAADVITKPLDVGTVLAWFDRVSSGT